MSRVGLKPITIPTGVTVTITDGGLYGYKQITVTGPKGELTESLRRNVAANVEDGVLNVARTNESKESKAMHGLYRTLINNMVVGVTEGYRKDLHIEGIGYRAQMLGTVLELSVGYSHKIKVEPPVGITLSVIDQTEITVTGINKQAVGDLAAKIRAYKKPEPYKGKGIRYKDEQVKRKDTKSTK